MDIYCPRSPNDNETNAERACEALKTLKLTLHIINNFNLLSERENHLLNYFTNTKLTNNTYSENWFEAITLYTTILKQFATEQFLSNGTIESKKLFSDAWKYLNDTFSTNFSNWKFERYMYIKNEVEPFVFDGISSMNSFASVPAVILLHAMLRNELKNYSGVWW